MLNSRANELRALPTTRSRGGNLPGMKSENAAATPGLRVILCKIRDAQLCFIRFSSTENEYSVPNDFPLCPMRYVRTRIVFNDCKFLIELSKNPGNVRWCQRANLWHVKSTRGISIFERQWDSSCLGDYVI